MDLRTFDTELRKVTPDGTRPFLCEGSPLDCKVFLVGLNPITSTSFWDYWDTTQGCSKEKWLAEYMRREGRLSRTRTYIECLWESLRPVRCLETNLYSARSKRFAELPPELRTTQVFDFLVATIKPRLLFMHGRPGVTYMEKRVGRRLWLEKLHRVELYGEELWVYPRHHLSYHLSKAGCNRLGARLRSYMLEHRM